ncbi:uncharacterized protein [Palaemon carinicauda]|uniref:uncharacterized protein n=1 Tax=Palaemon carinicauda TaxID=392227 RepID=UPI0035B66DD0
MKVSVKNTKAWLWLVMAYQTCALVAGGVSSPATTVVVPDIPVTSVIPDAIHEEADYPSPPQAGNEKHLTGTLKQEITNVGNITSIVVICPPSLPVPSLSDGSAALNDSDESALSTLLPNGTDPRLLDDSDNSGDISSPTKFSPNYVKVDLGALEFDRNIEVSVKSNNCESVTVDGGVPEWVERLSLANDDGMITLQKEWAKGANNLKKLWFRVPKGLIIDFDSFDEKDQDYENLDRDFENLNGIQNLCNVLPPTLEVLDLSRTPLELLKLDATCSYRLTRLEASHSSLSTLALCTPYLVSLHLSENSLEGDLNWMTCSGGLASVEYLQVNQNLLTEVSTCNWLSIQSLDLRHNKVGSLDLTSCPSSNLTSVIASHNLLVTPPILPNSLLHLDLGHNQLESLPMITPMLNFADFSHNNIIIIGKARFKRARKLVHLSLAYNHITQLKEHDLNGLRELRTLDMSHNRLREIAGTSLMSLRHLRELRLHHNHLSTLDSRDLASLASRVHGSFHHNPWHCVCQLLSSLQRLQYCPDCKPPATSVECRERGNWVSADPFLRTCLHAVQEVTQRLNKESDEDLSEEEGQEDGMGNDSNKGAVVAVPVFLILILIGAVVATSYRLYHRHKRTISARLEPIRNRCRFCGLCGCSPSALNNGDLNHRGHGELSQIDRDSDTETEL